MFIPEPVRFLQPLEVKALLQDPQRKDHVLILDVRDDDYDFTHINHPNYARIASGELSCVQRMDEFIRFNLHDTIDTVIVHCYLSQQRGPTTARRLVNRLSQMERCGRPEICVLAHGYRRWKNMFGDDPALVFYDEEER